MELLFRVLVGAFVCVAPTVLFVGFCRGLERMQNGEFVARVAAHHGATVEDLLPGTQPYGDAAERRAVVGTLADEPSSDGRPWTHDPPPHLEDSDRNP